MRNFDLISDIHTDIWFKNSSIKISKFDTFYKRVLKNPDNIESKTLVIAGDLGNYNNLSIEILKHLKRYYENIIIIGGNHEYYLLNPGQAKKYDYNSLIRYQNFIEEVKNIGVYFLEGESIKIDNIMFSGSSLWYDYSIGLNDYNMTIDEIINLKAKVKNDHKAIFTKYHGQNRSYETGYREMKVSGWDDLEIAKSKIEKFINTVKENNPDVLISHFAPNKKSLYNEDDLLEMEIKNQSLEELLKENIFNYVDVSEINDYLDGKVFVHGHIHKKKDYIDNNCRFIANPLGYNKVKYDSNCKIKTIYID